MLLYSVQYGQISAFLSWFVFIFYSVFSMILLLLFYKSLCSCKYCEYALSTSLLNSMLATTLSFTVYLSKISLDMSYNFNTLPVDHNTHKQE